VKVEEIFIMGKVYDWFEERLEIQAIADDVTNKYVPPHVNIFYCFGGIVFTSFIIQVATGFAMTFYYRPTVTEAFFSVQYIMNEVNFGWLIRSIHRWSASMMVLMMIYGSDNINYATFSFGISLIYFLIQNRFFSILLNIE
jgi:cytochrome b6